MKELKLSVIIPVYNVEKYIEACVECIYRQGIAEDEFEVILINDGSTDYSLKIIQGLAEKHHNISIISQDNQGPSEARNKGIKKAKGKYILFVDSDDFILDSSLHFIINIAHKYNLDVLKGDYIKANNLEIEKGINCLNYRHFSYNVKTGEQGFIEDYNPMYSYAVINLYRREFVTNNHLYFLEGKYFEDVAYTTEAYLKAKRFMAIPLKFYVYRQHDSSIMTTMNINKLYSMNDIILYNYNLQFLINLSNKGLKKLYFCLYSSLIINIWYLCHHRSLFPHRMDVINDFKKKIPNLSFKGSIKQRFVTFCYKYIPNIYISIRYCLAKTKFD